MIKRNPDLVSNGYNSYNAGFYDGITGETMKSLAEAAGLFQYQDLDLIKAHILESQTILEIGACYGRVIQYLQNMGFSGSITAIERSFSLFRGLEAQFPIGPELHHVSLQDFQPTHKFDLILWLWSGFADFAPEEQRNQLERIKAFLQPRGKLIIELLDEDKPISNKTVKFQPSTDNNKTITLHHGARSLVNYFPSVQDMKSYCSQVGFQNLEKISYQAENNEGVHKKRAIYILC